MRQVTGKVLWACVAVTIPVCSLAQEQTQAEPREAATEEQLENFKKAFGVCLEAKEYLVNY